MPLPLVFRAALFDLDGTLVRTFIDFPALRASVHRLAHERGVADAVEGETDTLAVVEKAAAALPPLEADCFRRDAHALLIALEEAGCAHPEPIPGATVLLHALRAERQAKIAVITRNARHIAQDLLRRCDLPCDVLIAREDTPEFKPHPAPLLRACAHMGSSSSDAVMVGDLWADIAAGRAANVTATIGIAWPHDGPDRFHRCRPDYEVPSLADAFPLLLGWVY